MSEQCITFHTDSADINSKVCTLLMIAKITNLCSYTVFIRIEASGAETKFLRVASFFF